MPFKLLNTIHSEDWKALVLLGAFKVPEISIFGDWLFLQGPENKTGPTKNVPSRINSTEFPASEHASFQADKNAYYTQKYHQPVSI